VDQNKVKPLPDAMNERIHDYKKAEVYTTAPWPYYREIILNRPQFHHTLTPATLHQLSHLIQILEINKDITAGLLISRHIQHVTGTDPRTGAKRPLYEKTFCGGMDVGALMQIAQAASRERAGPAGSHSPAFAELSKYFRSLYTLSWDFSKLRSPLIIAMDGLAVGAGAAFATHSRYRVATENTRMSFPQVQLGWFPDAGASYLLSRLDGKLGWFLALTGWTVRGMDAVRVGLATHYCESDELHRFGRRIGDSSLTYQFAEDTIEQSFGMFNHDGPTYFPLLLHEMHETINAVFTADSVEQVLTNIAVNVAHTNSLGASASSKQLQQMSFLIEVQKRILASSPTSLKVTWELLTLAQFLPLERCLQLEYRLSQNLLSTLSNPLQADLFTAPNFQARTLAQVTPKVMEKLFWENENEMMELKLNYQPKKTVRDTWLI
jgi:3-hydroxyisobutyryl-CoA hydrolase